MNHELAKTLTTALVQFIDKQRPEGTMCCSNGECESLEYHIRNNHFDDVEAFIQKKLSGMTEFEQFMDGVVDDTIRETYSEDGFKDICKDALALAKKELARRDEVITLDTLPPYDKGFQDGKAEAMADLERTFKCDPAKLPGWLIDELNKAYKRGQEASHEDYINHLPIMPTPPTGWGCDGTHCTNPQMDCINCPRRTTRGSLSTNTSSGTPTVTLHGNTSATDGKEHNPSFTD